MQTQKGSSPLLSAHVIPGLPSPCIPRLSSLNVSSPCHLITHSGISLPIQVLYSYSSDEFSETESRPLPSPTCVIRSSAHCPSISCCPHSPSSSLYGGVYLAGGSFQNPSQASQHWLMALPPVTSFSLLLPPPPQPHWLHRSLYYLISCVPLPSCLFPLYRSLVWAGICVFISCSWTRRPEQRMSKSPGTPRGAGQSPG